MKTSPDPSRLKKRSDLHLARKLFHVSGSGLMLVPYLVLGFSRETMAGIVGAVLTFVMATEYSRMKWPAVNAVAAKVMGPLLRDTELDRWSGIPFYMASCMFAFLVFPHHIVVLSILYLAFGDPSSSFFGVLYGKNRLFPNKSLQGTMGGFVVCALATWIYFNWAGLPREKLLVFTMIGGFAGSLAELLPLHIDDNFSIPVVSGAIMSLAFWAADLPFAPL